MPYKESVSNINMVASTAIAKKRFMNRLGGQATANQNTFGVVEYAVGIGETALVDHRGITTVEAGAAIAANVVERRLETDANGRAVTFTTGPAVAELVPGQSALAAGQLISVVLLSQ